MKRIITYLAFVVLMSCQNKQLTECYEPNWEYLKISIDNKRVFVSRENDTCSYSISIEDTIYAKENNGRLKPVITKFILSKTQRERLFQLAFDAITNPVQTDQHESCYAGNYLKITLEHSNTSIECKYSSISDWTKISPTLHKISELTFDKVQPK